MVQLMAGVEGKRIDDPITTLIAMFLCLCWLNLNR